MVIPLEWLNSIKIDVEVYEAKVLEGPRVKAEEARSIEDAKTLFMVWLAKNFERLLDAKAIAVDDERIYIVTKTPDMFNNEMGVDIDSLAKLAEVFKDLSAEY